MQARMAQMQDDLASISATGQAGGGMVEITLNGKQEIQKVRIDPAVVNPGDVDMLEDLVLAAMNDAQAQIQKHVQDSYAKVAGGLNIPGLNLPF
jgi:hypothetical protein